MGNPIVEIRLSDDRLISAMGFPILLKWHLYIESGYYIESGPRFTQITLTGPTFIKPDQLDPGIELILFNKSGAMRLSINIHLYTDSRNIHHERHIFWLYTNIKYKNLGTINSPKEQRNAQWSKDISLDSPVNISKYTKTLQELTQWFPLDGF